MQISDKELIKLVIEKAYIEGIHTTQDEKVIRSGFHKDFEMLVYKDDAIEKVTIDTWFKLMLQVMLHQYDSMFIKEIYFSLLIICFYINLKMGGR